VPHRAGRGERHVTASVPASTEADVEATPRTRRAARSTVDAHAAAQQMQHADAEREVAAAADGSGGAQRASADRELAYV
jgi:hypothetical protein